jgi:hypothetical protein
MQNTESKITKHNSVCSEKLSLFSLQRNTNSEHWIKQYVAQ